MKNKLGQFTYLMNPICQTFNWQLYWAIVFDIANCDIKGPLPEQLHRQLGRKYNGIF